MNSDYLLTSESTLSDDYLKIINPFWQQNVQKREVSGVDNAILHISSVIAPNSQGTVVLSTGRTEGAIKYKELFYNLFQNGFSVYAMDHRGQGQSQRLASNPNKGHVEDYQDYVADLHKFMTQIVLTESQHKPLLLCHSMGGTIGALYNLAYPEQFAKVIYASPMFKINAPIPVWLAKAVIALDLLVNRIFSQQPWYFPGQGDYQAEAFENNAVTHSQTRFQLTNQDLGRVNALLGGITTQWLSASLKAMQTIDECAARLVQPTLMLQAGADSVVGNAQQQRICQKMPNCRLTTITGAKHELLLEQDKYRQQALREILHFFQP
ncbi:MAG: alpha/beta fold hydrolase [Aestuariibacter sp.]